MVIEYFKNSKWIKWKKQTKSKAIGESRELTFELFKSGHSINQIAMEREFKIETIEGHIIELIVHSLIDVDNVLSVDKRKDIEKVLSNKNINSLKSIYEDLNENYTYFEIKCTLANLASKPD